MASKKRPKIIATLNFGSFPGKLMFSVGYSFNEICKILKKQKCKEWLIAFEDTKYLHTPDCSGFSSKRTLSIKGKEYDYNFLHLRDCFDYSEKAHSVLAHEAIHICTYNLSVLFDIVKENEAFAYTHTHILNQCYKYLRGDKK